MKITLKLISLASYLILLCSFETAPNILFVSSTYSGHEEITRQALNRTIKKFSDLGLISLFSVAEINYDLTPTANGLFGYKTRNILIHGNFAMDFPNQTTVLSLSEFWKISDVSNFDSPNAQVLHFLRNSKDSTTLISAQQTCLQARKNIKYATERALNFWLAGSTTKALFTMGLATHTIQDSFSTAHTERRSASNNYDISNICFYGVESARKFDHGVGSNPALCYHEPSSSSDVIWNVKTGQMEKAKQEWPSENSKQCDKYATYPQTETEKQACLNHEARLARYATEKYLYLVFSHLNILMTNAANSKSVPEFIDSLDSRLFAGPTGDAELDQKMPLGIMRCDALSNQQITGFDPAPNSGG